MHKTFNAIYGKPEDPFYYGTNPSEDLKAFLETERPAPGEALDLGCGEGRNTLLLAEYGYRVHAVDQSSHGIHKLERYAHLHHLENIRYSIADARSLELET